jgi:hypothetical protein
LQRVTAGWIHRPARGDDIAAGYRILMVLAPNNARASA